MFDTSDISSTLSVISANAMQNIVDKLRFKCYRDSTKCNYYGIWKQFNQFYLRLDKKPNTWEERLILFVAYLIKTNKKSNIIKCYVSAIKVILRDDNRKLREDTALLAALTKATWLHNDRIHVRLPIRKRMLTMLLNSVEAFFGNNPQPYLVKLYHAILCAAYYGLLRIGVIKAKDVHISTNKNKVLFVLHSSKTHAKFARPQTMKITQSTQSTRSDARYSPRLNCPFQILKDYLQA